MKWSRALDYICSHVFNNVYNVIRVLILVTMIEGHGGNGEEAVAAVQEIQVCWTGSSSNSSCNGDEKPLYIAVRSPR